jgi:hypothetical protein
MQRPLLVVKANWNTQCYTYKHIVVVHVLHWQALPQPRGAARPRGHTGPVTRTAALIIVTKTRDRTTSLKIEGYFPATHFMYLHPVETSGCWPGTNP